MQTHELLDQSFDEQFGQIAGLSWLPWVGLILGESVYNWTPACAETQARIEHPENLRRLHVSHALNDKSKARYVRNIERALFNKRRATTDERRHFWSNVTYHNLVLRMLPSLKHRPLYSDYREGWKVAFSLVAELNVDSVVVYGLEAEKRNAFNEVAESENIRCVSLKADAKIGRSKPRVVSVEINGRTVRFIFIRHPSAYFSWKKWAPYLRQHIQLG